MKRWGLLITLATMVFLGTWLTTRTRAQPPGPSAPAGGPQRISTNDNITFGRPARALSPSRARPFPLPPFATGGERRRPSDNPHGMPGHWRDQLVSHEPISVETIDEAAARMHLDPALTAKLQRWERIGYEAMLAVWEGAIADGDLRRVDLDAVPKIATARKRAFIRALGVPAWERFERLREAIRDGQDVDDDGRPPGWHPPRYPVYGETFLDPDSSEYAHLFTD